MPAESFARFRSYADLRDAALSGKDRAAEDLWYEYLGRKHRREVEERRLILSDRRTNPGRADYETLARYAGYLDREFPVPTFG